MSSIFAVVSGQFTKALILGALLPAAIFVTLWLLVIDPMFPTGRSPLPSLGMFGGLWQVVALLTISLVIAGLIFSLNTPIIRFYEGYPWQKGALGKRRKRHYQAEYRAGQARTKGMRTLLRDLQKGGKGNALAHPDFAGIWPHWSDLCRDMLTTFPLKEKDVLPTRLGNIIRSFEGYPEAQYKMDSIILWPRLIAVVDKEYAAAIGDAKTSFDFMLHSSLLNAFLALAILIVGLAFPQNNILPLTVAGWWLLKVVVFSLTSYVFYYWSISRASTWGTTVKGAFDLYRWELLKQMGFHQAPMTRQEERELWDRISIQILFGDAPEGPRIDYTDPGTNLSTFARGEPANMQLAVTRSLIPPQGGKAMTIAVEVKNLHDAKMVENVVITDTSPHGTEYAWCTATAGGRPIEVEGINPYRFKMGNLGPKGAITLNYQVVAHGCCEES